MNFVLVTKLHFDWTKSIEDFNQYLVTFDTHSGAADDDASSSQCSWLSSCFRPTTSEGSLSRKLSELKDPWPWWYTVSMHCLSAGILIAYGASAHRKIDDSDGEGPYIAYVIGISISFLDILFHLFQMVGLLGNNDMPLWAGFLARVSFIVAGHRVWFGGLSILFVVLASVVLIPLLNALIPIDEREGVRSQLLLTDDDNESAAAGEGQPGAQLSIAGPTSATLSSKPGDEPNVTQPYCGRRKLMLIAFSLSLLVIMFVPYVTVLIMVANGKLYSPDIFLVRKYQNQANFGAASMLLIVCFTMGYSTVRYSLRGASEFHFNPRVYYGLALGFYMTMVASGVIFYLLSEARFVLITSIVGPAIVLVGFLYMRFWIANDFEYLEYNPAPTADSKEDEASPLPTMGTDPEEHASDSGSLVPIGSGGADELAVTHINGKPVNDQDPVDMAQIDVQEESPEPSGIHQQVLSSYRIVVAGICYSLLVITYGVSMGLRSNPSWLGLTLGMLLLVVPLTAIPLWRYFHKENYDHSILVCLAMGLAVILTYSLVLNYAFLDDDDGSQLAMVFLTLLYPALVSGSVGFKRWHSHEWEADHATLMLLGACAGTMVGFDLAVFFVANWQSGVAVLVVMLLLGYAIFLLVVWIKNFFFLPRLYRRSIFAVGVVMIVLGALIAIGDPYTGFSVIALTNAALLISSGLNGMLDTVNRKVIFARTVFPAYRLDVSSREMFFHNTPVVALYAGGVLLIAWGLLTALLLEDSIFGISVVCLTVCTMAFSTGKAANALGIRLAATTEYVDLALLQSMKAHLLDRCGDAAPHQFFNPGSVSINSRQAKVDSEAADAWERSKTMTDKTAWQKSIQHYSAALDASLGCFESESLMCSYYELLIIMAAEFREVQEARDVEQFLRGHGIEGVTMLDLATLNPKLLDKLKVFMKTNRAEDERRRLLVEAQRSSSSKGHKRAGVGICDTVTPILTDADEAQARARVQQCVKDFAASGGTTSFEDADMNPYPVKGLSQWKRLKQLHQANAALFHEGSESADTQQGGLGDCWLIAAMSCVAGNRATDHSIEDMFIDYDIDAGIYCLRMYHANEPFAITIDDRVPTRYNSEAFCCSTHDGELWPAVVEKAAAKLYHQALGKDDLPQLNGYDQLHGGLVYKGVRMMTNAPTRCVTHSATSDVVVSGKLWTDLRRWHDCGYFLSLIHI
eukprot:TRINITY_DN16527_c0_g1_i3.p1 TRINITY_DN16527_c0_g1~~TRINITY_DN16527_c0_g1_i3.p1  ORF type:complete len:1197 (-),score=299.07 TRINITY_DN16527_c0_g1_i3:58-3648(-)